MDQFPTLKTGAVLQYPAATSLAFSTSQVRFVDGAEQRFRQHARSVRRWMVRLEGLDDAEMGRIEEFFASRQGRLGAFAFADPWDGTTYEGCRFETDAAGFDFEGLRRGKAALWIRYMGS